MRGGAAMVAMALVTALALTLGGCAGALPHRLAAPPIAGTVRVDVQRAGGWQAVAPTQWSLESPCSLRVRGVRQGELVRVRYASEPALSCSPTAPGRAVAARK